MIANIVDLLQTLPSEAILCCEYSVCLIAIVVTARSFGKAGLFVYIALAVIVGNIQVLKTANFSFLNFNVALGTIVFSSTFLVVDILNEFYGPEHARKAVWVGFIAVLFTAIIMLLTIGIKPVDDNIEEHLAIQRIFLPLPSLFSASIISYLICQYFDIWIFSSIRKVTSGRHLWLRTGVSTLISSFLDNIIFSTLAFVIFSKDPVTTESLIYTYILGTYIFRIIVGLIQTPVIYLIRRHL